MRGDWPVLAFFTVMMACPVIGVSAAIVSGNPEWLVLVLVPVALLCL